MQPVRVTRRSGQRPKGHRSLEQFPRLSFKSIRSSTEALITALWRKKTATSLHLGVEEARLSASPTCANPGFPVHSSLNLN